MYGSPFPKLNPKVRYKTVFERAGFDVNYKPDQENNLKALKTTKSTPNFASSKISKQNPNFSVDSLPLMPHHQNISEEKLVINVKSNRPLMIKKPSFNFEDPSAYLSGSNQSSNELAFEETIVEDEHTPQLSKNLSPMSSSNNLHRNSIILDDAEETKININSSLADTDEIDKNEIMDTSSEERQFYSERKDEEKTKLTREVVEKNKKDEGQEELQFTDTSNDDIAITSEVSSAKGLVFDMRDLTFQTVSEDKPEADEFVFERPDSDLAPVEHDIHYQDNTPQTPVEAHSAKLEQLLGQLEDFSTQKQKALESPDFREAKSPKLTTHNDNYKKSSFYLSGIPAEFSNQASKELVSTNENFTTDVLLPSDSSFHTPVKEELASAIPSANLEEEHKNYPPGEGPCRECHREITSKPIFASELSGQWHRECFHCSKCDIKFNRRIQCYILNNKPYCQKHYHIENDSICKICQGYIEGECLENDKKERFHSKCLTCFLCKNTITNNYFIFNDNIPLCNNHDMDALMRDGILQVDDSTTQAEKNSTPTSKKQNTIAKRSTKLISF